MYTPRSLNADAANLITAAATTTTTASATATTKDPGHIFYTFCLKFRCHGNDGRLGVKFDSQHSMV